MAGFARSEFRQRGDRGAAARATGGSGGRGRGLFLELAHARERVVGPGLRELFEIHVAVDARQQAFGAELGEPLVDHAAGFAELGIAGVTQREHRELQLGQLRRALGTQVFVEGARLVRRIAIAVRADHDVQQFFLGDLARLEVAGLDHARLHAECLHGGGQLLADLAAVAGVRGGDDGERRRGDGGRGGRERRGRGRRGGRRKLRARLRTEHVALKPGMLEGAAAAAPAKYPDSHMSCSRFNSVASCCN